VLATAFLAVTRHPAELVPLLLQREFGAWARKLVTKAFGDATDAPISPEPPEFAAALERARELARRGDTEVAWSVVAAAVSRWHSDDPLRIAPLTLLTDPVLSPLLIAQRAAWIATTPRGVDP